MVINTNIAATVSANNLDQSTNMLNESLASFVRIEDRERVG